MQSHHTHVSERQPKSRAGADPFRYRVSALGGSEKEIVARSPDSDADRHAERESLRAWTTRSSSQCGRVPRRHLEKNWSNKRATVEVVLPRSRDGGRGRASFRRAVRCKSAHACPVCGPARHAAAAEDLKAAVGAWRRAGGATMLLTLTIRHGIGQRLDIQVKLLTQAWSTFTRSRSFRRTADTLGVTYRVHSIEVQHGEQGWHPHVHALLLVEASGDLERRRAGAAKELQAQWLVAVRTALGKLAVPERQWLNFTPAVTRGATVTIYEGSGAYLVEGGRVRDGSGAPRSADAIMHAAAAGSMSDRHLWREYTAAMRGRHLVQGLGAVLKQLGGGRRAADEAKSPHVVVAAIPSRYYRSLARFPGGLYKVLVGAEALGLRGVAIAVAEVLKGISTPDPMRLSADVHCLMNQLDPRGDWFHPSRRLVAGREAGVRRTQRLRSQRIAVMRARRRASAIDVAVASEGEGSPS